MYFSLDLDVVVNLSLLVLSIVASVLCVEGILTLRKFRTILNNFAHLSSLREWLGYLPKWLKRDRS